MHKPIVLVVLDGWGYREAHEYNAIAQAQTPNWDAWWQNYPHTLLSGSGAAVGLPDGQMGNSEVGHMHLGAGRILEQEYTRINRAVASGDFFTNPVLQNALATAAQNHKSVHIMGLLSPGGVHSHEDHIDAMLQLADRYEVNVCLHAFLDGRDTPPRSAAASLQRINARIHKLKHTQLASVCGRYYAMDRDNRWDRIQKAYRAIVMREADYQADSAEVALAQAYARGENDEFVQPTLINSSNVQPIAMGDCVIFMNFRADRARQLSRVFVDESFDGFARPSNHPHTEFISLTQYTVDLPIKAAYAPQVLENTVGEYVAKQGLRQLRIAETEKYAHVTFFFNGGHEHPFAHEDRLLINSPQVATYDLQPEMSALELTAHLVEAIEKQAYDVIVCNYANADMVGHTGNFTATVKAIECLDRCLGQLYHALRKVGGEMLITADHGNAEYMYDEKTAQEHTAHTNEPVPLLYLGEQAAGLQAGSLTDIAPTLLHLLGLKPPREMTGHSLLVV